MELEWEDENAENWDHDTGEETEEEEIFGEEIDEEEEAVQQQVPQQVPQQVAQQVPQQVPHVEPEAIVGRTRRPPVWPANYTPGDELSDYENEANMAKVESLELMLLLSCLLQIPQAIKKLQRCQNGNKRWILRS